MSGSVRVLEITPGERLVDLLAKKSTLVHVSIRTISRPEDLVGLNLLRSLMKHRPSDTVPHGSSTETKDPERQHGPWLVVVR